MGLWQSRILPEKRTCHVIQAPSSVRPRISRMMRKMYEIVAQCVTYTQYLNRVHPQYLCFTQPRLHLVSGLESLQFILSNNSYKYMYEQKLYTRKKVSSDPQVSRLTPHYSNIEPLKSTCYDLLMSYIIIPQYIQLNKEMQGMRSECDLQESLGNALWKDHPNWCL